MTVGIMLIGHFWIMLNYAKDKIIKLLLENTLKHLWRGLFLFVVS